MLFHLGLPGSTGSVRPELSTHVVMKLSVNYFKFQKRLFKYSFSFQKLDYLCGIIWFDICRWGTLLIRVSKSVGDTIFCWGCKFFSAGNLWRRSGASTDLIPSKNTSSSGNCLETHRFLRRPSCLFLMRLRITWGLFSASCDGGLLLFNLTLLLSKNGEVTTEMCPGEGLEGGRW